MYCSVLSSNTNTHRYIHVLKHKKFKMKWNHKTIETSMIWKGGEVWPVTYMYVRQKSNGNASFCFCSIWVLSDKRHLDYFRGLFLASHVFCLPILYARPREVELWHWFCTVQGCLYLWQIVLSGALKWQIKLQGHRHKSIAGFRRKSCRWKIAHCLLEGILAVEEHRARKLDTWHLKAKNLIFADSPFVSP